ncbi:MBL fold metallo-hydrolase [Microbispora sp. ATCC PTA-5024]|uniref:MBL fold metallo-hydrolase n=1 Tax=Microbispora sp. ATCC PTA-5024 TaxID=316330 RepID=UPI0012EEAA97|nr:MBL fold metallo-hydrolase [Microbispora sp. ATCC PTA-5024]
MTPYTRGLHEIADGVWAWLQPDGGWGWSNAGLVAGRGASLVVDTLFDLALTGEMLAAMKPVTDAHPITDAVNTHGNGDHCFGNALLDAAVRIHGAPEVAERAHHESPEVISALLALDFGPLLNDYARRAFGPFAFDGVPLRTPDTPVLAATTLDVGGRQVRLLPLGPAHTAGDVAVHVPDANVLFSGDLLFVGGTPLMWTGPARSWIDACEAMIALEPEVIVPGHGPVTTVEGVREVQAYLRHVGDRAREAHAAGKTWEQAAFEMDLDRFARLPLAERVVVTTYAEYSHLDPTLPEANQLELFGLMARWEYERNG